MKSEVISVIGVRHIGPAVWSTKTKPLCSSSQSDLQLQSCSSSTLNKDKWHWIEIVFVIK